MARYHMVNEVGKIPVYKQSDLAEESRIGTLYNNEVFTLLEQHSGYRGVYEIRYLDSSGKYSLGFIFGQTGYSNLVYFGTKSHLNLVGDCYCFKLNQNLILVDNSNNQKVRLSKGDFVYTKSATAGASNPLNMGICCYRKAGSSAVKFDGFLRLNYELGGSMFNKNFCIGPS